jgi:hypothetical protein
MHSLHRDGAGPLRSGAGSTDRVDAPRRDVHATDESASGTARNTTNQIRDSSSDGRMISAIMVSTPRMHSSKSSPMMWLFKLPVEGLHTGPKNGILTHGITARLATREPVPALPPARSAKPPAPVLLKRLPRLIKMQGVACPTGTPVPCQADAAPGGSAQPRRGGRNKAGSTMTRTIEKHPRASRGRTDAGAPETARVARRRESPDGSLVRQCLIPSPV